MKENNIVWERGSHGAQIPTYRIFVRKAEEKMAPRIYKPTWNNIKMNLKETEWQRMEWFGQAQIRVMWLNLINIVMSIFFRYKCGKFLD